MKGDFKLLYGIDSRIGMRCSQLPKFKPRDCPSVLDCKSELWIEEYCEQLVSEYLSQPVINNPLIYILGQDVEGTSLSRKIKESLRNNYRCADIIGENVGDLGGVVDLEQYWKNDCQLVLFHRFVDQFNADALQIALKLSMEHKLPVVCLTNDFEHNGNLEVNLSGFEVHLLK